MSSHWCELSPSFWGFWCWAISCVLLVLLCKVLDVRKCTREKLFDRCQGLLAPQLPAPQHFSRQPLGTLYFGMRHFAPSFPNSLKLRGNAFPTLGAFSLDCFEMPEVHRISSACMLQLLTHSFWGSPLARSSLSNVVPCDWAQAMSTPTSKGPAGSRGLTKTRNVANKIYILGCKRGHPQHQQPQRQWKEVEGKVSGIHQDCAWCHPSCLSLCGLKSRTAPRSIELKLWWEPGEILTNTPAAPRHLLSTGEELHFLTEVTKGVNLGTGCVFGDGMAYPSALNWHTLTFLCFFPPTWLDFSVSQSSESMKSKACGCDSQEVSETEDRIERVPQVPLERKNKAKMQGGNKRRKN